MREPSPRALEAVGRAAALVWADIYDASMVGDAGAPANAAVRTFAEELDGAIRAARGLTAASVDVTRAVDRLAWYRRLTGALEDGGVDAASALIEERLGETA